MHIKSHISCINFGFTVEINDESCQDKWWIFLYLPKIMTWFNGCWRGLVSLVNCLINAYITISYDDVWLIFIGQLFNECIHGIFFYTDESNLESRIKPLY